MGERVELLERGQGSSPYDPKKTIFEGPGPAGHARPGVTTVGSPAGSGVPAGVAPASKAAAEIHKRVAKPCKVPRLKGLSPKKAGRRLVRAGLRLGKVRRVGRGRRLSLRGQSPRAGRRVTCGTRIKLKYRAAQI